MRKIFSLILTLILLTSCLTVSADTTYEAAVERVKSLELLNTDLTYEQLSRGEGIYALMRLYVRAPLPQTYEESVFSDVAADSYLLPYANYAYELGFVNGIGGGLLAPEEGISLPQFVKIAVSILGYKSVAERDGGYPAGYMAVASRLGLLKGVLVNDNVFTHKNAIILIDNMLEVKPLEPNWGREELQHAEETLYEQMMNSADLRIISGIVTAVEKAALPGESVLEEDQISVNSLRMSYPDGSADALLGRYVMVHYRENTDTALPVVVSIYVNERRNEELTVNAADIESLDALRCVYKEENTPRRDISFEGVSVFYNGRSYDPSLLTKPQSGEIKALDNDSDGRYEVLFVNEYVSFIADRILSATDTIYLQDGYTFRGKRGISFDFEDDDKEYEFYGENSEAITLTDILPGDVVSVWADMNEEKIIVRISRTAAEGTINEKADEAIGIDGQSYNIYAPNLAEFMSKYLLGQSGKFGLNHAGEIVGIIGEIESDICYGYVTGFDPGNGFKPAYIKVLTAGTKDKEVEKEGNTEKVTYTYTNAEETIYELEDKVKRYDADGTLIDKVKASSLMAAAFNRSIIAYELNSEGKIKSLSAFTVPAYAQAKLDDTYKYKLNGELNSFGGKAENPAFYVGETTQVICVPQKDNPTIDDYGLEVSVTEETDYTVMPLRIDNDTQIAGCVVILAAMDIMDLPNFMPDDDICVLGSQRVIISSDGTETYKFEVLDGENLETVFVDSGSVLSSLAASLKKGDLIRYEANKNSEVKRLEFVCSLSDLGIEYFNNNEGSSKETVFAPVTDIVYDRLDNKRNARVDYLTIDKNGSEATYTLIRKDGPRIYTYERTSGTVSTAVPEEIMASSQVGSGSASDVFMMICDNEPVVVINVID